MQTIAAIIVVKSKLIWCIVVFLRQKTQCNDHVRSTRIIFEVHCWLWFSNNRIAPLRCCRKFGGEITFILYIETHKLKLSFGGFDRRKKMLVGEKKKQWFPYHYEFCCFSNIQRIISAFYIFPSFGGYAKMRTTDGFLVWCWCWRKSECCFKFLVQDFSHFNGIVLTPDSYQSSCFEPNLTVSRWLRWCCKLCTESVDFCLPAHFSALSNTSIVIRAVTSSWYEVSYSIFCAVRLPFMEKKSLFTLLHLFLRNYFKIFFLLFCSQIQKLKHIFIICVKAEAWHPHTIL